MSNLVPFSFESHQVRVLVDDLGATLFVAKDVATALGYSNTSDAIKSHCRGVAESYPIVDALGRPQEARVIREADLYRLIFGSTLPSAQEFERMVVEEILPSIRKTGKYEAPAATTDLPRPREIREAFACCLSIAKLIGLTGNQASLSADSGTRKLTGVSALALIDQTHLVADVRGKTYTPTELGKMLAEPLTGAKFNRALEEKGLQVKNINNDWLPTETARDHCQWLDTAKRRTDGTPIKQLKWFASILPRLGLPLAVRQAA